MLIDKSIAPSQVVKPQSEHRVSTCLEEARFTVCALAKFHAYLLSNIFEFNKILDKFAKYWALVRVPLKGLRHTWITLATAKSYNQKNGMLLKTCLLINMWVDLTLAGLPGKIQNLIWNFLCHFVRNIQSKHLSWQHSIRKSGPISRLANKEMTRDIGTSSVSQSKPILWIWQRRS